MDTGEKSKFRYITEGRQRTAGERVQALARYREQLLAELGLDGSATISQQWTLDIAVVSKLEIDVLTTRFVRCLAKPEELERLNNAKNQLSRALRALGLPRATDDARREPGGSALARYLATREQAGQAAAPDLEGDADGRG